MTDDGIYNEWIRKSIAALAKLAPARYAREEAYDIATKTAR